MIDPAMTTKMTVQFNLFGGTVFKLGTERHHNKLLDGIDSLDDVGCFGLTELGYGNNAVEMETTAVYDDKTKGKKSLKLIRIEKDSRNRKTRGEYKTQIQKSSIFQTKVDHTFYLK